MVCGVVNLVRSTDWNRVDASVSSHGAVRRRTPIAHAPGWAAGLRVPGVSALIALAVLVYGGIAHLGPLPLALAGLAVLLVIVRASLALRDNARLLELSHHEAITDPLTGLGNRRWMTEQLAAALGAGAASPPATLVMFDLDGFKSYNDHFGHLAGDVLLADLGRRLQAAVADGGTAFRLGGDEFCLLLEGEAVDTRETFSHAVDALGSQGNGFSVTSSYGEVQLPSEASTPNCALRLADARMYAHKARRDSRGILRAHDALVGLGSEQLRELLSLIRAELDG